MTALPPKPLQVHCRRSACAADLYNYFGGCWHGPPTRMLLDQTAGLSGDGTVPLGERQWALAACGQGVTPKKRCRPNLTRCSSGSGGANFCHYARLLPNGFSE